MAPPPRAGLQRGDILVGLHQWETLNLENIQLVLTHPDLATFLPLRYYVLRGAGASRLVPEPGLNLSAALRFRAQSGS